MKKRNKIATLLLTAAFSATALFTASCGGIDDIPDIGEREQEKVDTTRTQLYVGNYNGGIGENWLWAAKELFEKDHPDVQIMIDNGKDEYGTSSLMNNIKSNRQDMYVCDSVSYYTLANAGHMLDITDLVTKGGENSVEARMNESLRDYYKTPEGKYYAVPFYEAFYHMAYDVDLFDEYNLWLNADGTGYVTSPSDPKFVGTDGIAGTWDDGLPKTYSQFFQLLDTMVASGITPLTWSGKFKDTYLKYFTDNLVADYMGEDYVGCYTYEGKCNIINTYDFTESATGKFSLPAGVLEEKTFDKTNAADTLNQAAAKYFAAKWSKDVMSGGYKYVNQLTITSSSETHLMAQSTFLRSRYRGQPISMLIDGGWWYNEAAVTMDSMSAEYGDEWSKTTRRFGVMPIPKADDGSGADGHTFSATGESLVFISAYSKKTEIAKQFFEFIHTADAMARFTKDSWCMRPYSYEMTDEDLASLPYYVKNVYECVNSSNVIFGVPKATSGAEFIMRTTELANMTNTRIGQNVYGIPLLAFFSNKDITSLDYFIGLQGNNNILK